ncbi:unnamed protein product [Heterobilharzia americana]|nr:unnamed protein product [Heterobilharzia americana]
MWKWNRRAAVKVERIRCVRREFVLEHVISTFRTIFMHTVSMMYFDRYYSRSLHCVSLTFLSLFPVFLFFFWYVLCFFCVNSSFYSVLFILFVAFLFVAVFRCRLLFDFILCAFFFLNFRFFILFLAICFNFQLLFFCCLLSVKSVATGSVSAFVNHSFYPAFQNFHKNV